MNKIAKQKETSGSIDIDWGPNGEPWKMIEGDDPYLGDPAVVEALVRNFLAEAIKKRTESLDESKIAQDRPDVEEWLKDETFKLATIFLGRSNAYKVVPEWNAPDGGILRGIRSRYDLKDATNHEVAAFPFYALLGDFLDAEEEDAKGNDWKHLIDGAVELVVSVLLGTDNETHPREA